MGLLFLVLFVLSEIALVVLSFTKWSEKSKFLKNRVLVTVSELLILLLIVVLPTTYMKWRFVCALVVLAVRCGFSVISYFAKRNKVQGESVRIPAPECLMLKELVDGALDDISGVLEYTDYKSLV